MGTVSRSLTGDLMEQADLVLTFEFAQRMRVLGRVLVTQVGRVSAPDSTTWDVADPYLRCYRAARPCADEIDAALDLLVPALTGQSLL